MNLFALIPLTSVSPALAQFLSEQNKPRNICGSKLSEPANATGSQRFDSSSLSGAQYAHRNGLGTWRVVVSTNSSAATIEDGRRLTENSPGGVDHIWLDPYLDINLQSGSNGYSACAYIFMGLPENTIRRGQDDDTTCT